MLNLRWSWHLPTVELFESIDPAGWAASGGDPVAMLSSMRPGRLADLAADEDFLRRLDAVLADLRGYTGEPRWYQSGGAGEPSALPSAIAYFSPEYGITAVLPQYSGGLGILAGDHLKSASDLGVPIIGVGLLYRHGYFTQSLSADGWQAERYPADDPNGLPLTLLRTPGGEPVKVEVTLAEGKLLTAQVWLAQVGRVPLLMLDSYVEENEPALHEVTDRLYGGGSEHRLRQELLLGIGGVRAVRAFCRITGHPEPEVFHTNEGHAGFLGLERIREYVAAGLSFDEALELSRAGTVFTTHTPVPAGIDRFPRELIERYFASEVDGALPLDRVLAFGAETYPGGDPHVFNMAVMGMRFAGRVNGVSVLHGEVSREMFAGLWPGFDTAEVPIGSITNGVHAPTWVAREVCDLGDSADAASADAERLWGIRRQLRARLVAETRRRLRESWQQRGASGAELTWIDDVLDENVLTIGFARRVPSYKRLTLMLNDPQRLAGLLLDPERPIQIVIAGKAHPADEGGKRLIQQMVQFTDSETVRRRIVFLPDYDMAMARYLVQGCDVWLNNPLRPLEACGTSGMKVALNGGLNLSVRDGWWDEWYDGGNGWEIPTADGVADPDRRDELEASALYELLAKSVAPLFYDAARRRRAARLDRDDAARAAQPRPARPGGPHGRRLRDQPVRAGRAGLAGARGGREPSGPRPRRVEGPGPAGLGLGPDRARRGGRRRAVARRGARRPGDGGARRAVRVRRPGRGGLRPSGRGRRDHRADARGARARRLGARTVLRVGGAQPARPVRVHGPCPAVPPDALQRRRARPGHLPGGPGGHVNRRPQVIQG